PESRNEKIGVNRNPLRYSGIISTTAWETIPAVAVPATSHIRVEFQISGVAAVWSYLPNIHRYTPRPMIETMLFNTGAHMYGPKLSRAFNTWPRRVYNP